jgi:flagellar hook-length control protein FliK
VQALDSPAFAPALATQVSWLVREGLHQARLSLNPAEMGPLAVKIVLDGTQARVDFSADLAATRAVIEASLPGLAAALHDSGLTLAGGSVFDGQARHGAQGERSDRGARPSHPAGAAAETPGEASAATPIRAVRGLIDLVA